MNTGELLSKLNKLNELNTTLAYIPSLGEKAAFKAISVKQQKDLIGTAGPGSATGILLNQSLNNVVISNSIDKDISFSIIDRYPVIVALRDVVDPKIKVGDGTVYIKDHLKAKEESVASKKYKVSESISESNVTINLAVPTLKKDIEINESLIKVVKGVKEENFGEVVGNLFIYEIIKFIDDIIIDDEEFSFGNFTMGERVKLVESLPVSINSKIIKYMEEIRAIENAFLETEFGSIEIDATFFTVA